MPEQAPNQSATNEGNNEGVRSHDANQFAGESLEGSGFENEMPESDFEWRD
jgi:hypothetical protein